MDRYSIYQVADILKTSHMTIYNRLENKDIKQEMKSFIIKHGKQRLIKQEGIEILRKYITQKENLSKKVNSEDTEQKENFKNVDNSMLDVLLSKDNKLIDSLEKQIEALKNDKDNLHEQLKVKDEQINQLLLGQAQQRVLLLESKHPKQEQKKNWFKRWFS